MPKTCVIGAGISGLATAWQLQQKGESCVVLEAQAEVGGAIRSRREAGFLVEEGPHSIQLNSKEIEAFLDSIPGLSDQIIDADPAANKRYILRNGTLHAVPMQPLDLLRTSLWSLRGRLRGLMEPFIPKKKDGSEESVADCVRRRLGNELYDYAMNPLVGGIYAGNPEVLSLRYAFPKLYELEQEHGGFIRGALSQMKAARKRNHAPYRKRIISFKEGLGALPNGIKRALGDSVQTNVCIESLRSSDGKWDVTWKGQSERFDRLIVTTPAYALSELPFERQLQEALRTLPDIDYPPVSVLSLGFKRAQIEHPLDGFGLLVPESERRSILGILFPSSVFKGRAPQESTLLSVFVGGERNPEYATADTEKLLGDVLPEINALLGVSGTPHYVHHKHWPKAIPQYKLGYAQTLETLQRIEDNHLGLHLVGTYRNGISVTDCLTGALSYRN